MKRSELIPISWKILQAILFKRRFPLAISWCPTYRCNLRCIYCNSNSKAGKELDFEGIKKIIDQLYILGTKFIVFNGGEPLLLDFIGNIVRLCKNYGIHISIYTNGVLFPNKAEQIRDVDEIMFSLDGPADVNDYIRGKGVYDKVIESLQICQKRGIKARIRSVITKFNIEHIPEMIKIGEEYNAGVYFQPVVQLCSNNCPQNVELLYGPQEKQYQQLIDYLITKKKEGCEIILNSISGLKHLRNWNKPTRIFCMSSLIGCGIEPDGSICLCDQLESYQNYLMPTNEGFKKAFEKLALPYICKNCWSATVVESCLLGELKFDAVKGFIKRFFKA